MKKAKKRAKSKTSSKQRVKSKAGSKRSVKSKIRKQTKTKRPPKSKKTVLPNTTKLKRVAKEAAVAAGVAALDTALSAMEPQRKNAAGSGAEKKDDPSKN